MKDPAKPGKPVTAWKLVGEHDRYRPLLRFDFKGMRLEVPLSVKGRVEGVSSYRVSLDRTSNQISTLETDAAGSLQARVGLKFDTRYALLPLIAMAEYEHDVVTGSMGGSVTIDGGSAPGGIDYPNSDPLEHQLRKAYGRISFAYFFHVIGGLMTSHWGLGLLANDGSHGWAPGNARFTDPRGGDRTARIMLATGPITPLKIFAAVGYDWVQDDDVTLDGDSASQIIGAITLGKGLDTSLGFYAVYRKQEAELDGDTTRITAMDLHFKTSHQLTRTLKLTLEAESALIVGETDLGSSPEYPTHDVLQLGMAVRATLDAGSFGGVLDFLFASGDGNFDDKQQNGFKADPNYEMGMLLYRHLMAGGTARAPYLAADPNLVGRPNEDLNRLPTRGSVTNTVALFPRAWWRPLKGLEVYGGPLFAFAVAKNSDPLTAKVSGGLPYNAFEGQPGGYLGTELDVGARFQVLLAGTVLQAGIEGGVLFPGSAWVDPDGNNGDAIYGGRFMLGYQL